jgi:putative ABC transport system substrate-binding protein
MLHTLPAWHPEQRPIIEPLKETLNQRGHVEGRNIAYEYRWEEARAVPRVAADLVRLKVDLIVVGSSTAALAAKQATSTIPIVAAVNPRTATVLGVKIPQSLLVPADKIIG